MGRECEAPVQERGSPKAWELEAHILCSDGGKVGLDGDIWKGVEIVRFGGGAKQHVGVNARKVGTGSKFV